MKPALSPLKSVTCVVGVVLAMLAGEVQAQKARRTAESAFSFDVYGDSRSMMYLPYKQDQEPQARELMLNIFDFVLPEKVADEVDTDVQGLLAAFP